MNTETVELKQTEAGAVPVLAKKRRVFTLAQKKRMLREVEKFGWAKTAKKYSISTGTLSTWRTAILARSAVEHTRNIAQNSDTRNIVESQRERIALLQNELTVTNGVVAHQAILLFKLGYGK